MARVSDALRRAQTGTVTSQAGSGTRAEDGQLEFFAHDGSAVSAPWEFDEGAKPAPVQRDPGTREIPSDADMFTMGSRAPRVVDSAVWASGDKLFLTGDVPPFAREQYRKLGAALLEVQLERQIKVILVTSALPGEGKTLTASNLALTLSESYGRRVGLIDGDLRKPTLHHVFGVTDGCMSADQLEDAGPLPLAQVRPNLWLLAPRQPLEDPMAALASDRMRQLIEAARARFDWVVLDTPPVALLPDASVLASRVDAVILVVSAGQTPYPVIQRACNGIGVERVMGVVLNRADDRALAYGSAEYYGREGDRP